MNFRISCCKDCTDRCIGCHSHCEKYKNERDKFEQLKKDIEQAKRADKYYFDYAMNRAANRRMI